MAHLYILTRGIKHCVDRLINDLQAQYFPMYHKYGKKQVQLGVRPIQLWELVLPESGIQELMRTLWKDGCPKKEAQWMQLGAIRMALKAKKNPPMDPNSRGRILSNENVSSYPIGYRDDKITTDDSILKTEHL